MRMSAAIASDTPMPPATPFRPATTGFSHSTRSNIAKLLATSPASASDGSSCSDESVSGPPTAEEELRLELRAERIAIAGDADRPDFIVVGGATDPSGNGLEQLVVQGVLAFRPIETKNPKPTDRLDLQDVPHMEEGSGGPRTYITTESFATAGTTAPACRDGASGMLVLRFPADPLRTSR